MGFTIMCDNNENSNDTNNKNLKGTEKKKKMEESDEWCDGYRINSDTEGVGGVASSCNSSEERGLNNRGMCKNIQTRKEKAKYQKQTLMEMGPSTTHHCPLNSLPYYYYSYFFRLK